MPRYLAQCALTAALVFAPLAALAQTPAAPPAPPESLPFGKWTIVNGQVDESGIVWSRCRGANGQTGRWISVHPAEVVHPTYVIELEPLMRTPTAPAAKLGNFVECVGDDGAPGMPDPALPATAILPRGTTRDFGIAVTVKFEDAAARFTQHHMFALRDGETAFDDGTGPVIVTASRIAVFPNFFTLSVGGPANGSVNINRPGSARSAAPTSCSVAVYEGRNAHRVVATENQPCTALSRTELQRVVHDARTQLAQAPR
ncbi:MAG: hypothetical protein M3169_12280 [Candidatus Eremiobacteraeota bacterium]|nr:hypothetical protein [Candidatus Eremiobacteraeota bacterium]